MNRELGHGVWLVAIVAVTIFGCSPASPPQGDGDTAAGASGNRAGGGAKSASSINACSLLTPQEIQTQLGVTVGEGALQTTDSQASCDWTGSEETETGVSVTVEDFDKTTWDFFAGRGKPVSGLGEAAFAGVPTSPALMIKQGPYQITVGVVDFKISNDAEIAAAKAFAALVLPRIRAG